MKTSAFSSLVACLSLGHVMGVSYRPTFPTIIRATTPSGCRAIDGDADFPTPDVWARELPGIVQRNTSLVTPKRPDYRFTAQSPADVEKAVKFAANYNVRLTVINTGHDYMGRNDAPTGLSLDTSHLTGVKVLPSFCPTTQGAESPDPSAAPNVITPVPGQQAAVTFGCSYPGYQVNRLISDSKLFVVSGTSPNVSLAGGWGQMGGHGPLTPQYGLGVDHFLEFKVVTADGQLKVANNVTNQDLFWALRGGGGSTFGVVTEATVKAYPQVPIASHVWWINSTTASALNGSDGLHSAIAYMASQLPSLIDRGASGIFYPSTSYIRGISLTIAENATEQYAQSLWNPVLDKMKTYAGMKQWQSKTYIFSSYQDFFEQTYVVGATPSQLGLDFSFPGDFGSPVPLDKFPFDSWLLDAEALSTLPAQNASVLSQLAIGGFLAVSGNKAHRPDDDVSVLPAWRQAYVHFLTAYVPPVVTADWARALSPTSGSYGNEAYYGAANFKQVFWGANYPRLSQIKTKHDPNNVFWATPGINADLMEVRDGRVCTAQASGASNSSAAAPATDNTNNYSSSDTGALEGPVESYGGFPAANDTNNS